MSTKLPFFLKSGCVAAALCVLPLLAGCQNWRPPDWLAFGRKDPSESTAESVRQSVPDTADWVRRVAAGGAAGPRWRHVGLEAALNGPAELAPDLSAALKSSNTVVAANAAIALAHRGVADGAAVLRRAASDPQLKIEQRAAAIEALSMLNPPPTQALVELIQQHGRFDQQGAVYSPELHIELLRAIAKTPSPAVASAVANALRSPSADVRLAAVESWKSGDLGPIPKAMLDLRGDNDPRVRAAVCRVLAQCHHPDSLESIRRALADVQADVRIAAVSALAHIREPAAVDLARQALHDSSEALRAEAVEALAALGQMEEARTAIADQSWRVRKAVARTLARDPSPAARRIAENLLTDPSVDVQREALAAIADWPSEMCEPLFFHAIERGGYLARKMAAEQLARRWPPALEFSADWTPEQRAESLRRLRDLWLAQNPGHELITLVSNVASEVADMHLAPEEVAAVRALLDRLEAVGADPALRGQTLENLRAYGERLPAILEHLARTEGRRIADAVYAEVLAEVSPLFQAIEDLRSPDVEVRRRAAVQLGEFAAKVAITQLAGGRIATLAIAEADPLVWRALLMALGDHASPELLRLFSAAAGHPSPEVRRLACECLGNCVEPQAAELLILALDDPNAAVVLAAVRALGESDAPIDTSALERLLTTDDKQLRLEVAVSLAKLGRQAGVDALERLSHDVDPRIRVLAAQKMGAINNPEFTAALIRLLDDQLGVRQAAIASLEKIEKENAPVVDAAANLIDQTEAWKRWWNSRPQAPTRR